MSAGLDQRAKGQANQVANSTKDGMKDGFDAYLQPTHQAPSVYNAAPMSSPVSDHYMSSYYPSVTFPYLGEGTWSNGDPMSFLGGYNQMNNEYMPNSGMFGFSYSQPGFPGWDFPGSDYTSFTWGSSAPQQAPARKDARYEDVYCHPESMRAVDQQGYAVNGEMDNGVKQVEQGMKQMNMGNDQYAESELAPAQDNGSPPCGASEQPASSAGPKKMSWANVASQPAKPKAKTIPRAPVPPYKHSSMDIGTWETKTNMVTKQVTPQGRQAWPASSRRQGPGNQQPSSYSSGNVSNSSSSTSTGQSNASKPDSTSASNQVLDKLRSTNQYNPKEFNLSPKNARFFIIKSYSEDDIHRSIKYSIWCSTEHGNKRLDKAYRENEGKGPIYLLYSVNGSGHFCGMAEMLSAVDYNNDSSVWAQDKWKGQFEVKWIYVKDVPNSQLRHIRLENNENKPVTNSRDTQEVPIDKGRQVLKIIHSYRHTTSIFDDFTHYEKRQEELGKPESHDRETSPKDNHRDNRSERQDRNDRNDRNNDRDQRQERQDRRRNNRDRD